MGTPEITLAILFLYLVYDIIITQIQKKRIEGLKSQLEEQSQYVKLIKDFADLKSVDEFKKYVELRLENKDLEAKKLLEENKKLFDERRNKIVQMTLKTALPMSVNSFIDMINDALNKPDLPEKYRPGMELLRNTFRDGLIKKRILPINFLE